MQPDPIARLTQACNPSEELDPTDPRFVDFTEARGENVIDVVERKIRRAGEKCEHLLFAGHIGIGKSSLLKRLKANLEREDPKKKRFLVVWIDTTKQLDPNDLDFPDLLVLVAAEVQRTMKNSHAKGFSEFSIRMKSLWDSFKSLMGSEVQLKEAEVDVPFGSLTLEFKNRPTSRQKLREGVERLSTELLGALNELLADANTVLRQDEQHGGLVLIVDGLEKISLRQLSDGVSTHDRLFIQRSPQLASIAASTIYTVPISLYYSERAQILEQAFGEFSMPVPMIKVRPSRDADVTPESIGMQKLWELLDLRCQYAGVKFAEAFKDDETWQKLCEMSGGHPRHLLMLVNSAASQIDELPISIREVNKAVQTYANSLLRQIPDASWPLLRKFGQPQSDIPRDGDHQALLYYLYVLEYQNGRQWYEVNPVIRTLNRFGNG